MGTVILTVTATDADSGNFALIEYSLGDGEGKFAINPTTVSRQTGGGKGPGSEAEKSPQVSSSQFLGPAIRTSVVSELFSASQQAWQESQTSCGLWPFCLCGQSLLELAFVGQKKF